MKLALVEKVRKLLTNPQLLLMNTKLSHLVSDKTIITWFYEYHTGKKLDLSDPKTFNEKIQWLKLYDHNPIYTVLVDKLTVREHVERILGMEYLIPHIGVYESPEEIDFSKLPDTFVLKCTHDSGGVVICSDRANFDERAAIIKLKRAMKTNPFWRTREWPYKDLIPKIICEKYIVDESGYELKDYKFFCFDGEPKLIQVDFGRFSNHRRNIYDTDWNLIPLSIKFPDDPTVEIPRPSTLDHMMYVAKKLSKGFVHVRVDLYSVHDKVYFGELTFHHGSGIEEFNPDSYNALLGSWIHLPSS